MNPEEINTNQPITDANATVESTKKEFKLSTGTAILAGAALIALVLLLKLPSNGNLPTTTTNQNNVQPSQPTTVDAKVLTVRADDRVHGDPSTAKVIAFEYSDSDCPYCQQFHATMKQVFSTYGANVAWVYRYFPLSIHPDAGNEAIALECSAELGGNTVFYQYLDKLFGITVTPDQSASLMISTATSLGLDEALFKKCLQNPDIAKKVQSDSDEAQSIGAQGTPFTVLVNKSGKQIILPGAYPWDQVKSDIDSLLK